MLHWVRNAEWDFGRDRLSEGARQDLPSRFLLTCEALSSTREEYAFTVFERLF
jgi:hypothetical protein